MIISYEASRTFESDPVELKGKTISDFVADALLLRDHEEVAMFGSRGKIPLEERPVILANALGKLIDLLASKNLLTADEICGIVDVYLNNPVLKQ